MHIAYNFTELLTYQLNDKKMKNYTSENQKYNHLLVKILLKPLTLGV